MTNRTNSFAKYLDEVVEHLKKKTTDEWEFVKVSMEANPIAGLRSINGSLPTIQQKMQMIETLENMANGIEEIKTEPGREWVAARDVIEQMNNEIRRLVRLNSNPELIVNELRAVMILEDYFGERLGPGI